MYDCDTQICPSIVAFCKSKITYVQNKLIFHEKTSSKVVFNIINLDKHVK